MKKTLDIKKLILLNMPYILLGLFATNFGEAWRMAQGADASEKFLSLIAVLPGALESDAIGIIYEDLKDTHCKFCGAVDTAGYTFDSSIAVVDGKFVGLPIDEVNEDNQTEERISAWAEQVKQEIS